jgi:hypothetical protein
MSNILLGADNTGSGSTLSANRLFLGKFTALASGTMNQIQIKITATGNVKVAIYADNAGEPGSLLNSIGSTAVTVGVNSITFPDTTIISGTPYWLAFNQDTNLLVDGINTGGTSRYATLTYTNDFPDPPTGLSSYTHLLQLAGWNTPALSVFIPRPIFF